MIFLTGHGVAPGIAIKAFKRYGAGAIDVVRSNPYRLAEEIFQFRDPYSRDKLRVLLSLDADKTNYVNYYEAVLPLLRPGGWIAAETNCQSIVALSVFR